MARKLFCEWSPLAYKISVAKGIFLRKIIWQTNKANYAKEVSKKRLSHKIYVHKSLIRRRLGNVDMHLQNNKAINLSLAAPKINGVLIRPNEIFSFWKLVGNCSRKKGYQEGLVIKSGQVSQGIGGGMCQLTNLIHWMILHSPMTIVEHHHHNQIDMFPDYGRQVPFGSGTSVMYNYLDYQFVNETNQTFQLIIYTTDTHLCGELRSDQELEYAYHIVEEKSCFVKELDGYYRNNELYRKINDKITGNQVSKTRIVKNHAKVLYDASFIQEKRRKYMRYKYILFDLDGTLTDPKTGITKSVAYSLKKLKNIDVELDQLTPFIGPPLKDSYIDFYGFSESEAERAIQIYREYFKDTGIYENEIYNGMKALLETLKDKQYILGVATSKPTMFAERIIEHFDLDQYFSCIVGSNLDGTRTDKAEVIAEALAQLSIGNKEQVVMVGDRKHDILGAKKMQMDSIGVTYGYGSYQELNDAGADYIVDNIDKLKKLFE